MRYVFIDAFGEVVRGGRPPEVEEGSDHQSNDDEAIVTQNVPHALLAAHARYEKRMRWEEVQRVK